MLDCAWSAEPIPHPGHYPELEPKPQSIFTGDEERSHHLGIDEIAIELVQFAQPEIVAVVIEAWFGWIVRIATKVAEVLHQHKRFIELAFNEIRMLSDHSQSFCPGVYISRRRSATELINYCLSFSSGHRHLRIVKPVVNKLGRRHRVKEFLPKQVTLNKGEKEGLFVTFQGLLPAGLIYSYSFPNQLRVHEKVM